MARRAAHAPWASAKYRSTRSVGAALSPVQPSGAPRDRGPGSADRRPERAGVFGEGGPPRRCSGEGPPVEDGQRVPARASARRERLDGLVTRPVPFTSRTAAEVVCARRKRGSCRRRPEARRARGVGEGVAVALPTRTGRCGPSLAIRANRRGRHRSRAAAVLAGEGVASLQVRGSGDAAASARAGLPRAAAAGAPAPAKRPRSRRRRGALARAKASTA